jgi:hypothetical protein
MYHIPLPLAIAGKYYPARFGPWWSPAAALLAFMMVKNTDAQDETDRFLAAWLFVTVHPSLESRKKSPNIGPLH